MAKQSWFPKKESDRRTLLNNLADTLPGAYATKYGITALWKYRALYLDGDAPFGQWSDPASIAVQG